jgi:hypothetical protein
MVQQLLLALAAAQGKLDIAQRQAQNTTRLSKK